MAQDVEQTVLDTLHAKERPLTPQEIADVSLLPVAQVKQALDACVSRAWVEVAGLAHSGHDSIAGQMITQYRLTDAARADLDRQRRVQ